jgi:hypothetical protein
MGRSAQVNPVAGAVQIAPRAAAQRRRVAAPSSAGLHYAAKDGIFCIADAAVAYNDAPTL